MFKNKPLLAFTLVEILIVVSLIATLSVSVISIINPTEQKNKADDAKIKTLISEIFKAHLRYSQYEKGSYLDTPIVATQINSPDSIVFLETLISADELKESLFSDSNLNKILLSTDSIDNVALCFLPKAKNNQLYSDDTRYDIEGFYRQDCSDKQCYFCLTSDSDTKDQTARITIFPSATPDPCLTYNKARPNFPFITDFTDKYSEYGCTNFSIQDRSCDSYCPSGQRHLIKNYYGVPYKGICESHATEIKENYCVSEPYANCIKHSTISGDIDFNWGCTNPRRPYSWK